MSKIAIIGSGINGLVAAHGLLRQGHDVTLHSERSADDWLTRVAPTGTAARFPSSLRLEERLGLNHWDAESPAIRGIHLTFCMTPGRQLIDLIGRLPAAARAIDVRLQSNRWTRDLEERGGKVVVEAVNLPRLDEIASASDLTLVAVGRGDLGGLFRRDEARSVHQRPPRKLTMMIVKDVRIDRRKEGIPFDAGVKFNLTAKWGEQFSIPYWHKDGFAGWNLLFEAKEGSPFDAFDDCKDGEQIVARAREVFRKLIPWDFPWFESATLADEHGWLKGGFVPCFRDPVGVLPSGRVVMALGDTANSLDPIGGQGANNGYRQIMVLLDAVAAHGDRPFDEAFMRRTFATFYETSGRATNLFNDLLLEPITPAAQELLIAQYGSDGESDTPEQRIADRFVGTFDDPTTLIEHFRDIGLAKSLIGEVHGGSATMAGVRGRLRVAKGQLRQLLGIPRSSHPLASMRIHDAGKPAHG